MVVASGKGGVGRSVIALNLAVAFADLDLRVVLAETASSPAGLEILWGGAGMHQNLTILTGGASWLDLWDGAGAAGTAPGQEDAFDLMIVDAGPGLEPDVIDAAAQADVLLVVTSVEVTSIIGAYALIKEVVAAGGKPALRCVVNGAPAPRDAESAAAGLALAVSHFLRRTIEHVGTIPSDAAVRSSVAAQRPLLMHDGISGAALSVRALADQLQQDLRATVTGRVGTP
jgi:flagellar biosynthesis protein FlhG